MKNQTKTTNRVDYSVADAMSNEFVKQLNKEQAGIASYAAKAKMRSILEYGYVEQKCFELGFKDQGYTTINYFASDFAIAEYESVDCILETTTRQANNFKSNVKQFTELVMTLLWEACKCHSRGWNALSSFYYRLFTETKSYGEMQFTGADWKYYSSTLKRVLGVKTTPKANSIFKYAPIIYC